MRRLAIPLLFVVLAGCGLSRAAAQTADSVDRLKQAFGPPKPPRVHTLSYDLLGEQLAAFKMAGAPRLPPPIVERITARLALSGFSGETLGKLPADPWKEKQGQFNLTAAKLEAVGVEAGVVALKITGTIDGYTARERGDQDDPGIAPALVQIGKDGKYTAAIGKVAPDAKRFWLVCQRTRDATSGMLLFLNEVDGSIAVYRDASSGKPEDHFAIVKLDEKSLLDAAAKQPAENKIEAAKLATKAADEARAKAAADEVKANAEAVRHEAAMKAAYKQESLRSAKFRAWNVLGGSKVRQGKNAGYEPAIKNGALTLQKRVGASASDAKIAGYENGTVTLEKRDGKTVQVRRSRLNKADREYLDAWLAKAQVDK